MTNPKDSLISELQRYCTEWARDKDFTYVNYNEDGITFLKNGRGFKVTVSEEPKTKRK